MQTELVLLAGLLGLSINLHSIRRRDQFGYDAVRYVMIPGFERRQAIGLLAAGLIAIGVALAVVMGGPIYQLLFGLYLIAGSLLTRRSIDGWMNQSAGHAPQLTALIVTIGWPLWFDRLARGIRPR